MRRLLIIVLTVAPICMSSLANAQAPDSLSFQGYLTDSAGVPLDTLIDMSFKLYKGATEIWSKPAAGVTVSGGVFNVILGGSDLDTVAFNQLIDLGITVGGNPEILPRTPLAAAAYAKALPGLYTFHRDDGSNDSFNVIGGAANNVVGAGVVGASIGGGGGTVSQGSSPNRVLDDFGTIGGGSSNTADGSHSTVGGGRGNTAGGIASTIGGGQVNSADGDRATVAGGWVNSAGGELATVGGGESNHAQGGWSTVVGGFSNSAMVNGATVGGGSANIARGLGSTVPGGERNSAFGAYSFGAGYNAKATHNGTFVWNDRSETSQSDSLFTTGENQFLIRAAGVVGIGTNEPAKQLSVAGSAHISDSLGIGTSSLEAPLHVQIDDLDVGGGERAREGILLEKNDAVIGVYSNEGGNWGSAVVLAEMNNDLLSSKWAMVRSTQGNGNDLHFKYGTSSLYENNSTRFEITNDGRVISFGIRPFTNNGGTSGSASQRWTEVFATNGVINTSDLHLKQDIENIADALVRINALRPVMYRWKSEPEGDRKLGLIAQEVELIVPEVVRAPENDSEHYGLNYAELVPLLIKAIQEQQATIDAQETEIDDLRAVDSDYNMRLAALETRLQP